MFIDFNDSMQLAMRNEANTGPSVDTRPLPQMVTRRDLSNGCYQCGLSPDFRHPDGRRLCNKCGNR